MLGSGAEMDASKDHATVVNAGSGIVFRACDQLFTILAALQGEGWTSQVSLEMIEIYNEKLRDLLVHDGTDGPPLALRTRGNDEVYVENLSQRRVQDASQATQLVNEALSRRCTKSTRANACSSRSHCIFSIRFEASRGGCQDANFRHDASPSVRRGVMHFCDLAGSERLAHSGSDSDPALLREAQAINKSLSTLGQAITALVHKEQHVPYRDSKLTYLLRNSLGGQAKCLMLCNLSPEDAHLQGMEPKRCDKSEMEQPPMG